MAKSKKERRSSIRHMQAEGDVLAIFDALERAEREESVVRSGTDGDETSAGPDTDGDPSEPV